MKHLVLFGDSLFGQCGKSQEQYFSGLLKNEYEVYNFATGGWDTTDARKKATLIAKTNPDVVLISLGTNDACSWKQVPLDEFKQNLPHVYEPFRAARVIFFPPPPVVEADRPKGKEISNSTMLQYNQAVVVFCQENSLEYWDSWSEMVPLLGTENDPHSNDGVHFSDDGYKYVLGKLAEVVA